MRIIEKNEKKCKKNVLYFYRTVDFPEIRNLSLDNEFQHFPQNFMSSVKIKSDPVLIQFFLLSTSFQ